jgi:hypothetical protein
MAYLGLGIKVLVKFVGARYLVQLILSLKVKVIKFKLAK